jgi:hypothetical protein
MMDDRGGMGWESTKYEVRGTKYEGKYEVRGTKYEVKARYEVRGTKYEKNRSCSLRMEDKDQGQSFQISHLASFFL